jgi:exodeoxyribonuclease V alpha subunit
MAIEYQERAIDRYFAAFVCRQAGREAGELFRLVVSLASSAAGKGNICLNLADIAGSSFIVDNRELRLPGFDDLMELLKSTAVVSYPAGELRPLVLDASGRLYLCRYWKYERELAGILLQKASAAPGDIDETQFLATLQRLFPGEPDMEEDRQKIAAAVALRSLFSVISGGPGTGKTSTVVRILALLMEQPGEGKRIALVAPTGKAAARLNVSIQKLGSSLDCSDDIRAAIPDDVVTIQRLLGTISGSSRFRYSTDNPLPYDTVIVDEASMVSLPLMFSLVSAMRSDARLVLLGDKDQLASVEAGAVFSDICNAAGENRTSVFSRCITRLERNFRFKEHEGIARLGRLVISGRDREALEELKAGSLQGISWHPVPSKSEFRRFLAPRVTEGYRSFLEATTPGDALERFDRFRVLCALREGAYGVSGLNRETESILHEAGFINPSTRWYRGRPLLVTANDYPLRLFNGDCGICLPEPENCGAARVFFAAKDGNVRSVSPERLPQHETAYAMTVHKSQGSEFERVLLILPPTDNELLARELLYTGLTRAKHSVELVAEETVFCAAVRKRAERKSGLTEMLQDTPVF